jgi:hypothetical protein
VFCGKLHGNGHKIKNMTIVNTGWWLAGLFGHLGEGALIENLHIAGDSIYQPQINYPRVASIAGRIYVGADATEGVTITNCSSDVSIRNRARNSNTGNMSGGLVGEIVNESLTQDVIISSCYNTGKVAGGNHAGGIVGLINGYAIIRNCYFNGEINRNDTIDAGMNGGSYRGGIAGIIKTEGIIENCYATGVIYNEIPAGSTLTSTMYSGGIVARAEQEQGVIRNSVALQTAIYTNPVSDKGSAWRIRGGTPTQTSAPVTNCYAIDNMDFKTAGESVIKTSTDANSPDGADVTPAAAKTAKFYTDLGWDFTNVWTIEEGVSFPTLRQGTGTGIQLPRLAANTLKASALNGVLTIKGLVAGEKVRVYTSLGQTISERTATASETTVHLPVSGIYIVAAGNKAVKVKN